MDDKLPISAQTHREDSFDTAVRGYNRQQVLEYMSRSSQLLASLEQNLAVARADAQRARAEAERAQAEAERLRAAQIEAKPVHEEVSGRLSQILRLAAEEADQDRATANEEIARLRAESQAESQRMINEARAEAERDLSEARDTAERELAEARDTAERELAEARATAEDELQAAQDEAERIRIASEERSAELLDDAARRAGAVNEVSDQRLDTLTATHGEAVLRLGQIRDVLADLLERDAAAGSLADVVEAVIAPSRRRPELDPTSVVPAVTPTAVHEPVTDTDEEPEPHLAEAGEVDEFDHDIEAQAGSEDEQDEQDAEDERVQVIPLTDTVEHHIDLREQSENDRPVPTHR
jgi:hypothetical protein